MSKIILGAVLGIVLGIFDGLTALAVPETAPQIGGILVGSSLKGLIAGLAIGYFARKVNSIPKGILFGFGVGLFLAFWVAFMQGKYWLEIMVPGSIVGIILGYATQKYGDSKKLA